METEETVVNGENGEGDPMDDLLEEVEEEEFISLVEEEEDIDQSNDAVCRQN
jgi:hypothetical protein